jgi:hypothetical protein
MNDRKQNKITLDGLFNQSPEFYETINESGKAPKPKLDSLPVKKSLEEFENELIPTKTDQQLPKQESRYMTAKNKASKQQNANEDKHKGRKPIDLVQDNEPKKAQLVDKWNKSPLPGLQVKVDQDDTQELNSMLSLLGFNLGSEVLETKAEERDEDFVSSYILLLDNGRLKSFERSKEGKYFAAAEEFQGDYNRLSSDSKGKYFAVGL